MEGNPPYYDVHPLRVLFMIPTKPTPELTNAEQYSPEALEFTTQCLNKDGSKRPTADALLNVCITRISLIRLAFVREEGLFTGGVCTHYYSITRPEIC